MSSGRNTVPESERSTAYVRRDTMLKLRAAPAITADPVGVMHPGAVLPILQIVQGRDNYRWIQTEHEGIGGYVRADLLVYDIRETVPPDADPAIALNDQVLYPSPLKADYAISEEYGATRKGTFHKGIDLTTPRGGLSVLNAPLYSNGNGRVQAAVRCTKCTEEKPNFRSHGLDFWDTQAVRDAAWGYGFGNYLIVCHSWTALPITMRETMTMMQLTGGFAYVLYGHLSRLDVAEEMPIHAGTQIGLLGNTGNSTGEHLHLEVHVSIAANDPDCLSRLTVNPRFLFEV